ncbi:MAG: hypothetical protein ACE5EH_02260 [Gammaproteobacteria bacterium]
MNSRYPFQIKEIIIYAMVAFASLVILGYSVHMLIGDIVSPSTEKLAIIIACVAGAAVIAFMAWDVVKQRKNRMG